MRGQAEVWTNMTVDDLAKSTKRSIGNNCLEIPFYTCETKCN